MPRGVRMKEFRKEGSKATRVWRIGAAKGTVYYEAGQLDGKMVLSSREGESKNVGRANEVTPEEDAKNWMARQIELKTRQGYREVDPKTGVLIEGEKAGDCIDFNSPLPENYRIYKPQNSLGAGLKKKLEDGKTWAVRKRDGNGAVVYIDRRHRVSLYTLTMQATQKDETIPYLQRYPKIEEAIQLIELPPKCMLAGELVVRFNEDEHGFHVDDLDLVNGIRGSKTDEAIATQEEYGHLGYCIWDIVWWHGENWLRTKPYRERYKRIVELVNNELSDFLCYPEVATINENAVLISPPGKTPIGVDVEESVEQTLCDIAVTLGWEGWVIVDPDATYGDKSDNFRGKADRPKYVAKLKPSYEGDFIVRWDPDNGIGRWGKGRKSSGVGSLQCYLMHPTKGEIEIALVGGGLTDEDVVTLADPSAYPLVAQVEFGSWTKNGSLQFPEFLRIRDDKVLEECGVDQNPNWERHYG